MGRVYPNVGQETALSQSDFDLADGGNKEVSAGEENEIGEFIVPAQEVYRYGYGAPRDERNQGFMFADIRNDDDEPADGKLWLVQTDAPGDERKVVKRISTQRLRGDRTDINSLVPLPEQGSMPFVGENSRLRLLFIPDEDETVSYDNSEIEIPTTRARPHEV